MVLRPAFIVSNFSLIFKIYFKLRAKDCAGYEIKTNNDYLEIPAYIISEYSIKGSFNTSLSNLSFWAEALHHIAKSLVLNIKKKMHGTTSLLSFSFQIDPSTCFSSPTCLGLYSNRSGRP